MNCNKCGGELFADLQSIRDANTMGYRGGRWACVMSCTSIWLTEFVPPPVPLHNFRYKRDPRELSCFDCGELFLTYGNNTKRCEPCRAEYNRTRNNKRAVA